MTILIRLALAILATYRVAQFVVYDDGPFDVMFLLRQALGRYRMVSQPETPNFYAPETALGRLLECVHCVGKWVAILAVLLVWCPTMPGDLALIWLGVAGGQMALEGGRKSQRHPAKVRIAAGEDKDA